ncbi:MAG: flagellar basal body L-ring protein FlgH [Acidobacteria bacterium]|nr:flagellar basal body L-ring protein FlgH [Acidobacteriota bacterium]
MTHKEEIHQALALKFSLVIGAVLLLIGFLATPAHSQAPHPAQPVRETKRIKSSSDPATSALDQYLDRVRATGTTAPAEGSIWTENGRLARMSTDVRALRPNDLIAIVVAENLESSHDGSVKGTRASSASSAISAIFSKLSASSAAQNLINQNSNAALNAQGQSANNSSLATVLGGQVVDVLPNGILVIEAARQVEFSQQTQTIVLRGLVRPEDISQQNQVLSTAISSLELQVRGKGIVTDYTRRPNLLVRLLQRAIIF